jgi:Fic family protein
VEFLTIHPFANQNGLIAQVLMELLAFQAKLEPFNISNLLTNHKNELLKSLEEIRLFKNISSFLILLNKEEN